jgi:general secretion pathway protein B
MSFILDALKRSENERAEQAGAEFANVPGRSEESPTPRWLWVLGALLAVNAAILLGLVLRPGSAPETVVTPSASPVPVEPTADAPAPARLPALSFDDRVAEVRRSQPVSSDSDIADSVVGNATGLPAQPQAISAPPQRNAVATDNLRVTREADLPTLTELRVTGRLELPELHVDIHVYNSVPSERFVFINMDKYEEGSRLSAGPVIREITNDGVILEYQNIDFLLLRD